MMDDETLLYIARRGDLALLLRKLDRRVAEFDRGGGTLSVKERLLIEALDYARAGNLDEATHRLRLWYEPKWHSEHACKSAYQEAMREKRTREAVPA